MAVPAMGETPTSPLMSNSGTVEPPVFVSEFILRRQCMYCTRVADKVGRKTKDVGAESAWLELSQSS
jgi:hypothetical protein